MRDSIMTLSKETEYLLESASRMMDIDTWEWDVKNDHITLSKNARDFLKINASNFDGHIKTFIDDILSPDYLDIFNVSTIEAFNTGVTSKTEYILIGYDGNEYWVRFDGTFEKDENGEVINGSGILINITPLKKINDLVNKNFDFLETFIQLLPTPMYFKDPKGYFRYCNKAFCEFVGLPPKKIINHTTYDITTDDLADFHFQVDNELLKSGEIQIFEKEVQYNGGILRDVIFNKSLLYDKEGQARGIIGLMMDITTQKNNQRLIERQNLVKDILIHISHNITDYDTEKEMNTDLLNRLLTIFYDCDNAALMKVPDNDKHIEILSCTAEEHIMTAYFSIPLSESYLYEFSGGKFTTTKLIRDVQQYQHNKGPIVDPVTNMIIHETLYIPIFDEGKLEFIITFNSSIKNHFRNIDCAIGDYIGEQIPIILQVFHLQQNILKLSRYDALTGLMNRHYFNAELEDSLMLAHENKQHLMLIAFDLDQLKLVNDTLGHKAGDTYLQTFAHFIQSYFDTETKFARLGGDEFSGLLLTEDPENLMENITKAQNAFTKSPLSWEIDNFECGFSYGIAIYPEDGSNIDQLMSTSDKRMYDNKLYRKSKRGAL